MAHSDNPKTPTSSNEHTSSSSSSDSSGSTPNTPPSPIALIHEEPAAPPPVVSYTPQYGRRARTGQRKAPKTPLPSKTQLGVIDEHSADVLPDVPPRNPLRKLGNHAHKMFYLNPIPTLHAKRHPPKNIYDDVEGPNGEKFMDVRENKKSDGKADEKVGEERKMGRLGWKKWICLGCLLLIIALGLGIGLGVGLKVRADRNSSSNQSSDNSSSSTNASLPTGSYLITTYLSNINTSCVSNSATWRCYPDQTYSQSPSGSLTPLTWIISSSSANNYTISSADPLFNYAFQNAPLRLQNNGTADEFYEFQTTFTKVVVPSGALTSDNAAVRCFFNDTTLTGVLYTKKPMAQALQNATTFTSGSNANIRPWQTALFYYETHNNGQEVPDCYKWIDGARGAQVDVSAVVTAQGGEKACRCYYTNFF